MKRQILMDFMNHYLAAASEMQVLDGSGRPNVWLTILPGMMHYNVFTFPDLAGIIEIFLTSQQD